MRVLVLIMLFFSTFTQAIEITFKNCSNKAMSTRCEGPWLRRSSSDLNPGQSYAYETTADGGSSWNCQASAPMGNSKAITDIALVPLTNFGIWSGKDTVSFSLDASGNTVIFNGDNQVNISGNNKSLPRYQVLTGAKRDCLNVIKPKL
jgi:hypothetical protein